MRNWGLAAATLDLESGELSHISLHLIRPKEETSKQVRKNSKDLEIAQQLSKELDRFLMRQPILFVEIPVGSQSARAMASYGLCVGILGSLVTRRLTLIEVSPTEVKKAFTGNRNATKQDMIAQATLLYPDVTFPMHNGKITSKAEHVADALGAIHAGVKTPAFQNLLRLYKGTQ